MPRSLRPLLVLVNALRVHPDVVCCVVVVVLSLQYGNAHPGWNAAMASGLAFAPSPHRATSTASARTTIAFSSTWSWSTRRIPTRMTAAPRHRETVFDQDGSPPRPLPLVQGTYRPFVQHAWDRLQQSGLFEQVSFSSSSFSTNNTTNKNNTATTADGSTRTLPLELQSNQAPAKGMPEGTMVRMETAAMVPSRRTNNNNTTSVVRYARYALLETLPPNTTTTTTTSTTTTTNTSTTQTSNTNATSGIQVLNLVVFPSVATTLPVWGVDLVSLPGNKHLLAMDVQPMVTTTPNSSTPHDASTSNSWKAWYDTHVVQHKDKLPWGGDIPDEAASFFSSHALWTRLQEGNTTEAVNIIQDQVYHAFCDHLDLYLQLLQDYEESSEDSDDGSECHALNHQDEYLQYRLANDPARPMLRSLYGPEWTERVLTEVLFPML